MEKIKKGSALYNANIKKLKELVAAGYKVKVDGSWGPHQLQLYTKLLDKSWLNKAGKTWHNFWNLSMTVPMITSDGSGRTIMYTGTADKNPMLYSSTPEKEAKQAMTMSSSLIIPTTLGTYGVVPALNGMGIGIGIGNIGGNATKNMIADAGGNKLALVVGGAALSNLKAQGGNLFDDGGDTDAIVSGSMLPEVYRTPYDVFTRDEYPRVAMLYDRLLDYDEANPQLEGTLDDAVTIRNNGRLNTAVINPAWIKYIAETAREGGYDPVLALGLASRESTIGNDTDGTTGSLWREKTKLRLRARGINPDKIKLHIGLPFELADWRAQSRKHPKKAPYELENLSYRYNAIMGNHDHYDNQFPYYRIYNNMINSVGLDRSALELFLLNKYDLKDFNAIPTNSIIDALDYYSTGKYNTGWKGQYPAVERDRLEVLNTPQLMDIINEKADGGNLFKDGSTLDEDRLRLILSLVGKTDRITEKDIPEALAKYDLSDKEYYDLAKLYYGNLDKYNAKRNGLNLSFLLQGGFNPYMVPYQDEDTKWASLDSLKDYVGDNPEAQQAALEQSVATGYIDNGADLEAINEAMRAKDFVDSYYRSPGFYSRLTAPGYLEDLELTPLFMPSPTGKPFRLDVNQPVTASAYLSPQDGDYVFLGTLPTEVTDMNYGNSLYEVAAHEAGHSHEPVLFPKTATRLLGNYHKPITADDSYSEEAMMHDAWTAEQYNDLNAFKALLYKHNLMDARDPEKKMTEDIYLKALQIPELKNSRYMQMHDKDSVIETTNTIAYNPVSLNSNYAALGGHLFDRGGKEDLKLTITGDREIYLELKAEERRLEAANTMRAILVPNGIGINTLMEINDDATLLSNYGITKTGNAYADLLNAVNLNNYNSDRKVYGATCINTATAAYGPASTTFSNLNLITNPRTYGFDYVDYDKPAITGDIIQLLGDNGTPYHAGLVINKGNGYDPITHTEYPYIDVRQSHGYTSPTNMETFRAVLDPNIVADEFTKRLTGITPYTDPYPAYAPGKLPEIIYGTDTDTEYAPLGYRTSFYDDYMPGNEARVSPWVYQPKRQVLRYIGTPQELNLWNKEFDLQEAEWLQALKEGKVTFLPEVTVLGYTTPYNWYNSTLNPSYFDNYANGGNLYGIGDWLKHPLDRVTRALGRGENAKGEKAHITVKDGLVYKNGEVVNDGYQYYDPKTRKTYVVKDGKPVFKKYKGLTYYDPDTKLYYYYRVQPMYFKPNASQEENDELNKVYLTKELGLGRIIARDEFKMINDELAKRKGNTGFTITPTKEYLTLPSRAYSRYNILDLVDLKKASDKVGISFARALGVLDLERNKKTTPERNPYGRLGGYTEGINYELTNNNRYYHGADFPIINIIGATARKLIKDKKSSLINMGTDGLPEFGMDWQNMDNPEKLSYNERVPEWLRILDNLNPIFYENINTAYNERQRYGAYKKHPLLSEDAKKKYTLALMDSAYLDKYDVDKLTGIESLLLQDKVNQVNYFDTKGNNEKATNTRFFNSLFSTLKPSPYNPFSGNIFFTSKEEEVKALGGNLFPDGGYEDDDEYPFGIAKMSEEVQVPSSAFMMPDEEGNPRWRDENGQVMTYQGGAVGLNPELKDVVVTAQGDEVVPAHLWNAYLDWLANTKRINMGDYNSHNPIDRALRQFNPNGGTTGRDFMQYLINSGQAALTTETLGKVGAAIPIAAPGLGAAGVAAYTALATAGETVAPYLFTAEGTLSPLGKGLITSTAMGEIGKHLFDTGYDTFGDGLTWNQDAGEFLNKYTGMSEETGLTVGEFFNPGMWIGGAYSELPEVTRAAYQGLKNTGRAVANTYLPSLATVDQAKLLAVRAFDKTIEPFSMTPFGKYVLEHLPYSSTRYYLEIPMYSNWYYRGVGPAAVTDANQSGLIRVNYTDGRTALPEGDIPEEVTAIAHRPSKITIRKKMHTAAGDDAFAPPFFSKGAMWKGRDDLNNVVIVNKDNTGNYTWRNMGSHGKVDLKSDITNVDTAVGGVAKANKTTFENRYGMHGMGRSLDFSYFEYTPGKGWKEHSFDPPPEKKYSVSDFVDVDGNLNLKNIRSFIEDVRIKAPQFTTSLQHKRLGKTITSLRHMLGSAKAALTAPIPEGSTRLEMVFEALAHDLGELYGTRKYHGEASATLLDLMVKDVPEVVKGEISAHMIPITNPALAEGKSATLIALKAFDSSSYDDVTKWIGYNPHLDYRTIDGTMASLAGQKGIVTPDEGLLGLVSKLTAQETEGGIAPLVALSTAAPSMLGVENLTFIPDEAVPATQRARVFNKAGSTDAYDNIPEYYWDDTESLKQFMSEYKKQYPDVAAVFDSDEALLEYLLSISVGQFWNVKGMGLLVPKTLKGLLAVEEELPGVTKNIALAKSHEVEHELHVPESSLPEELNKALTTETGYFVDKNNTEVGARIAQVLNAFGIRSKTPRSGDWYLSLFKRYLDLGGLNNRMAELYRRISSVPNGWNMLAKWANNPKNVYSTAVAAGAGVTLASLGNEDTAN